MTFFNLDETSPRQEWHYNCKRSNNLRLYICTHFDQDRKKHWMFCPFFDKHARLSEIP